MVKVSVIDMDSAETQVSKYWGTGIGMEES